VTIGLSVTGEVGKLDNHAKRKALGFAFTLPTLRTTENIIRHNRKVTVRRRTFVGCFFRFFCCMMPNFKEDSFWGAYEGFYQIFLTKSSLLSQFFLTKPR
jgi:hypothetical protein